MSMKRFGYEFLIIVILILAAVGIWMWKDHQRILALEAAQEDCTARVEQVVASGEQWAAALVDGEAEATFRAFASGIHPLILRNNADALDQAVGALLELPGIAFVHVVAPDGAVLASSDRKLVTTGQVGEDGAWVLTTADLEIRDGEIEGLQELAAPVIGASGPAGFLWLGYETGNALEDAKPRTWPGG